MRYGSWKVRKWLGVIRLREELVGGASGSNRRFGSREQHVEFGVRMAEVYHMENWPIKLLLGDMAAW